MREKHNRARRILGVLVAVAVIFQPVFVSAEALPVNAAQDSVITSLVTEYQPALTVSVNEASGFTHPGVGLTADMLNTVQEMIRAEADPWAAYFEDMLLSGAASRTPSIKMGVGEAFSSQGTNGKFRADALTAYTQAVLYYVTGDNVYRRNAMNIIRRYETLDPEKYVYFTDAHIHTGIPANRICIAAEILRCSSYRVTDGYTEEELAWTREDTEKFTRNLVRPVVEVFQSSPDHFMNQHLYAVMGAMSGYLFMDDKEGYAKTVEWFTVNKNARDQGFNGSIKRLFRKITTVDEVGEKEGSGTPLAEPVIQHMEMGRDQAHGCGDLTNAAIIARLMQAQGTRVDPREGTVSTAADAVDVYSFLDNRILEAAEFFFQYMLGYDSEWVQAPFAIKPDGTIKDNYADFSPQYRGRYQTINFWDLYTYYTYTNPGLVDLERDYPYFYEGFMKKMPSNYYWNGSLGINWDNVDGGGDFWLFLPDRARGDAKLLAKPQVDYKVEIEDRGSLVRNREAMSIQEDAGIQYIRFAKSEQDSRVAITSGGGSPTIALRIRTDGMAKLTAGGTMVYLPNTGGQWQYVTADGSYGDLYYIEVSDITGSYVDIDAIDIKPTEAKEQRDAINIVRFADGNEDFLLSTYVGAPFAMTFGAEGSTEETAITYAGIGLPQGAEVDAGTGAVQWTPGEEGVYTFYVAARAGSTTVLKKLVFTVSADRNAAILQAIASYDEQEIYTSDSLEAFQESLAAARLAAGSAAEEEFAARLNQLCTAVAQLKLVSPLLEGDPLTDGRSLDYTQMIYRTNTGTEYFNWADGNAGTFVGFYLASDKADYLDFGPDYKVSASKFGFQARMGFSDRLAGVQVFGSNDNKNWTKLTVKEAEYTQAFHTVDVEPSLQNEKYRYLKIQKTTEYPDVLSDSFHNLLEFGELRIWGTRYETGNMIQDISMASEQLKDGRIQMGDTVTVTIRTKGEIQSLDVKVQGIAADMQRVDENTWTGSAVMQSCPSGNVKLALNYVKLDNTAGDSFYETTDGSSLFLVNSDIYIDAGLLAASMTASSGSWDGKLDARQCAALLFDRNTATFGDLKNTVGEYYTVDFGEGVAVALSEVMLMPRSTAQNHADRLNGTIISGSNDGENWIQLTRPVTGAVSGKWVHLPDLLDTGAYRYFKISGAEQGDIAEVEFYGSYEAAPELVASRITAMEDQQPSQSMLKYPVVPGGFSISVKSSSHPQIVALDGSIEAPREDTVVTLVLTVTSKSSGKSADTVEIPVMVKSMGSLIEGMTIPAKGADALTLPAVPEGFSVTVESSSNEAIVALGTGAITTPEEVSLVDVTLKLVRDRDGAQTVTGPYTLLIYGREEPQKVDVTSMATISASCSSWGKNDTLEQAAAPVFDGNINTAGDLKDGNGYYTLDFGEKGTVLPASFRLHPRSTHVPRLNGTVIEGSMDGSNWVSITAPFSGAGAAQYYVIPAEQFVGYGSYRYLRIRGAANGNIAEVEVYGAFQFDVDSLNVTIGTPLADAAALTLPEVPAGYSVGIAASSDLGIVALDGSITRPEEDTLVEITLELRGKGGDVIRTYPAQTVLIYGSICQQVITVSGNGVITATEDAWPAGHNRTSIAELLIDKDTGTYGDLKGNGAYIIDFGEGNTVLLDKVRVYPRDTKADHIARINGTYFAGSHDGSAWVQITPQVSGVTQAQWQEFAAEDFLAHGRFRYIKVDGAIGGNIAEIELYGVYQGGTPEEPENPEGSGTVSGNDPQEPEGSGTVSGNDPQEPEGSGTVSGNDPQEPEEPGSQENPDTPDSLIAVDWKQIKQKLRDTLTALKVDGKGRDKKGRPAENAVIDQIVGGQAVVPKEIFRMLRSEPVTLALHTGSGVAFTISGQDVPMDYLAEMDLSLVEKSKIPQKLLAEQSWNVIRYKVIGMNARADLGMTVNMHIVLGKENADKFANLYRYDEEKGRLVYISSFLITKEGQAMFGIRKGAEYLITVTDTMPKDTVGHSVHVVRRVDTLSSIAGRNGMKLQELLSKNPHIKNPGKIYPGMEINLD